MQLLRADANLSAHAELGAVGEAARRVDVDGRGADLVGEPCRRRLVAGHDHVGVVRAVPLDVLDGLETIKICTGYRMDGELHDTPPLRVERYAECQPVYEEMPGWTTSTVGVTELEALPAAARRYLSRWWTR